MAKHSLFKRICGRIQDFWYLSGPIGIAIFYFPMEWTRGGKGVTHILFGISSLGVTVFTALLAVNLFILVVGGPGYWKRKIRDNRAKKRAKEEEKKKAAAARA